MDLRPFIRERYAVVSLALLFLVCTAFVLAHPHSLEKATVPDERSYYGWARLYNEGVYHVPLYDWYGVQTGLDYHVNSSGLHYLVLHEETVDAGGGKMNLEVRVTFQTGVPASGAKIHVFSQKPPLDLTGTANSSGSTMFSNIPRAVYPIDARYEKPAVGVEPAVDLRTVDLYDAVGFGEPYQATVNITSFSVNSSGYQLTLLVRDSLGTRIPDASVMHADKGPGPVQFQPVGTTSSEGVFTLARPDTGGQILQVRKDSRRGIAPIASVVPYGGTFVAVNHWAPGYSILLGLMDRAGIAELTAIFCMALATVSTYLLARRLFGWKVALVSTILLLTAAVALLLVWTSGMADYASMTFALAGVWLLVEAAWTRRKWFVSAPLGLLGGLAFGVSVWIRYSTASVLIAVAFLLLALSYKDWRELRDKGKLILPLVRRFLTRAGPFAIGLSIMLIPLAVYNSTYFGGPLGASHNYGERISVDTSDGNSTATVTQGNVYSNFDPVDSMRTMGIRLQWLLLMMPVLLFAPVALYMGRRRLAVLFLLAFLLSNIMLYIFVPWVASWQDPARSMEDTRYFLAALPSAAILAGLVVTDALLVPKRRRVIGLCILVLLVVAGFVVAEAGIGSQMARMGGPPLGGPDGPPPPPEHRYTLVSVSQLLSSPATYNSTLVEVRNCTFDRWVNPQHTSLLFRDQSSATLLRIDLIDYTPPALGLGTLFHVKGVFRWIDGNGDHVPQIPELVVTVKGRTTDSITLA